MARPAPVVRSPQWATPPPTDAKTPPVVIESTTSPQWAAPPLPVPDPEDEDEDEPEEASETDAGEPEAEAETDTDTETEAEAETDTDTETEAEAETAVDAETEEPEADAEAETAAATEPAEEIDPVPEVSEWSPVAKPRRRRGAKAATPSKAKDASWWEAALSSGDSEAEAEE